MIYFVQRADGLIKIGTSEKFERRLKTLEVEHGELELLGVMNGGFDDEQALHRRFARFNVQLEWFKPDDLLLHFIEIEGSPNIPANLKFAKTEPGKTYVRSRLRWLVIERERQTGKRLMGKDISAATGLMPNTISTWMKFDPIVRVDCEAAEKLCRFFNCDVGGLLEIYQA